MDRATAAWAISSSPEGIRSSTGASGRLDLAAPGSGSRSKSTESSSAPDTPSTVEWCILATKPMSSSASPSTIHISHSGRARSSWWPVISPVRSASSRSPPGLGHRGPSHVVVDVEPGVVDPHRVAEAERHLDQPAPEHRGGGDAAGDPLLHPLERVAPRDRRRVEDQGHGHVHVEARGLEVEEAGVESAESFHRLSLRRRPPCPPAGPSFATPVPSPLCPGSDWFHFSGRTVFDGGVAWVFLAVSIAFAVLVVNAYHPVKREPFTVVSFALGWIPGELPLQVGAVEVAGAAVLWPQRRPPRLAGLGGPGHRRRLGGRAGRAGRRRPPVPGPWSTQALDRRHRRGDHRRRLRSRSRRGTAGGGWSSPCPFRMAGHQAGQEHRLLGRRELPAQARHPDPSVGDARAGPGPRLHPRWGVGHRGQAAAGHPDDPRAGPARLGVRGHQLPAQPPGHLAGPHRRLQAGRGLGARAHRRVRGRPRSSSPSPAGRPAATCRRCWPSPPTGPSGSPGSRTWTPRSTPACPSTACTT